MASSKRAIILDQEGWPSDLNLRVAFWLDVPAARQSFYARAGATSQWRDAAPTDITALQNGSVYEIVEVVRFPAGTAQGAIATAIAARWQQLQDEVNARNPWMRYGTTYNPNGSWSQVSIP